MEISRDLPIMSRINAIPGGKYTLLAAVGILAVVAALFLKRRWADLVFDRFIKSSGFSSDAVALAHKDPKVEKLFKNIFDAKDESPESRMTNVPFSRKEEGSIILGQAYPFLKIIGEEILDPIGEWKAWGTAIETGSQVHFIRGSFFGVEGNDLTMPTRERYVFLKFSPGDKIISFDFDGLTNVVVATSNKIIEYWEAYSRESPVVQDKIVSVHFYERNPIIVTEKGEVFSYNRYHRVGFKQIKSVEGGPYLSAKGYESGVLMMESDKTLVISNLGSEQAPSIVQKPIAGPSLFEYADGFTFIAHKELKEIYLCDLLGVPISTLKLPEKIHDLRFDDNKLYIAGETQGFIWDFNK